MFINIPLATTVIGTTKSGHNVRIQDIQSGIQFQAEQKPDENQDSIGIHIDQVSIRAGRWERTINIAKSEACDILINYFNQEIYPTFQRQMPDLHKSDAFGYFVVRALPKKNSLWNQDAWFRNALELIKEGKLN